jgi:hypothetical protein
MSIGADDDDPSLPSCASARDTPCNLPQPPRKLNRTLNQEDSPTRVLFSFRSQGPRTLAPTTRTVLFHVAGQTLPKLCEKLASFPRARHEQLTADPPLYQGTSLPWAEQHRQIRPCIRAPTCPVRSSTGRSAFVSGHEFTRAEASTGGPGFSPCGIFALKGHSFSCAV